MTESLCELLSTTRYGVRAVEDSPAGAACAVALPSVDARATSADGDLVLQAELCDATAATACDSDWHGPWIGADGSAWTLRVAGPARTIVLRARRSWWGLQASGLPGGLDAFLEGFAASCDSWRAAFEPSQSPPGAAGPHALHG